MEIRSFTPGFLQVFGGPFRSNNLDTPLTDAFPIYVYEPPNNDGALAWYCKDPVWYEKALLNLVAPFVSDSLKDYSSVYSLPYITIKVSSIEDMDNLNVILAHELTHHFHQIYYNDKSHTVPGFTSETTANLTAASVVDIQTPDTVINRHANSYVSAAGYCLLGLESLSSSGYAEFVWAKSYMDVVDNGLQYLKESLLQENPYRFLCEKAGDSYHMVLEDLAVRNITKDYEKKTFVSTVFPNEADTVNQFIDTIDKTLYANCLDYYYLDTETYLKAKTSIVLKNTGETGLFVKRIGRKGEGYGLIDTLYCDKDSELILADFTSEGYREYDEIILAVGLREAIGEGRYQVTSCCEIITEFYKTYTGLQELNPWDISGDCITIYVDDFVAGTDSFADLMIRAIGFTEDNEFFKDEEDVREFLSQFESELRAIREGLKRFSETFEYEIIRIYTIPLEGTELSYDEAGALISGMLPKPNLKFLDTDVEDSHLLIYAGFQPFSDTQIVACVLAVSDDNSILYRIELEK
ncbi:MAG: hypothetical protein GXZ01_00605 [Clostridiaceae bacterium]|nr:hypothetical protein [Clostridiaceae bacterium]